MRTGDGKASFVGDISFAGGDVADIKAGLAALTKGLGYDETLGTKAKPAKSCKQLLRHRPALKDGLYYLDIKGKVGQVYCDMEMGGVDCFIRRYCRARQMQYLHAGLACVALLWEYT